MVFQQQHAVTVSKYRTNRPCAFWRGHQYGKTTTSTMTDIFTSLNLHPQQKLKQNGKNHWHKFSFHSAWQKQMAGSARGSNNLNNSSFQPQAQEVPALRCYYILYILSERRNKVSSGPHLVLLHTVPLCDFILCRKSKYLPRHIKRKKTSKVCNLRRKLSALEFTFSVAVRQHTCTADLQSKPRNTTVYITFARGGGTRFA